MPARTLTIRGVPETTLRALRAAATANYRSLNGELLAILARAAAPSGVPGRVREPAPASYPATSPGRRAGKLEIDGKALAGVCRRFHIRRLALFGSHARGDARPDSDVDLVVDFEPGMTPGFAMTAVAEALQPAVGGRRVDLVTRRGLRPAIRDRIDAEAVPLHGG